MENNHIDNMESITISLDRYLGSHKRRLLNCYIMYFYFALHQMYIFMQIAKNKIQNILYEQHRNTESEKKI